MEPWSSDLVAALEPGFKLTATEALAKVAPTTLVMEQKLLEMLRIGLRVAEGVSGKDEDEDTPAEGDEGGTDSVGPAGDPVAFSLPGEGRSAKELPGHEDNPDRPLGIEPSLQYTLATALNQEVQILNRYVRNAAQREKYRPYLTRIQVSLMPKARNAPYDAYTTISFFPAGDGIGTQAPQWPRMNALGADTKLVTLLDDDLRRRLQSLAGCNPAVREWQRTMSALDSLAYRLRDENNEPRTKSGAYASPEARHAVRQDLYALQHALRRKDFVESLPKDSRSVVASSERRRLLAKWTKNIETMCREISEFDTPSRTPVVVPLLVTDSIESADSSRSTNIVRQLALALSGVIGSFSLGANAESFSDHLLTTVGHDYNSLYTVSRLSDNTLRVRMGAFLQNTSHFAMVPQTRNVSVLILVPDELETPQEISVMARTEFVDAQSGKALPVRDAREVRIKRQAAFATAGIDHITCPTIQEELSAYVYSNTYGRFVTRLRELDPPAHDACRCSGPDSCPERAKAPPATAARRPSDYAEQAWVTLLGVLVGNQFASARFKLPDATMVAPPNPPNRFAIAQDDGEDELIVELVGVRNVDAARVSASLHIQRDAAKGDGEHVTVLRPLRAPEVDGSRGLIRLVFPSLARISISRSATHKAERLIDVVQQSGHELKLFLDPTAGSETYEVQHLTVAKKKIDPKPRMAIKTQSLVRLTNASSGELELDLVVSLDDPLDLRTMEFTFKCFKKDGTTPATGKVLRVDHQIENLVATTEVDRVVLTSKPAIADRKFKFKVILRDVTLDSIVQVTGALSRLPKTDVIKIQVSPLATSPGVEIQTVKEIWRTEGKATLNVDLVLEQSLGQDTIALEAKFYTADETPSHEARVASSAVDAPANLIGHLAGNTVVLSGKASVPDQIIKLTLEMEKLQSTVTIGLVATRLGFPLTQVHAIKVKEKTK
ncbi:MAG: hypothetical protein KDB53_03445 [Planctomycetes bacterium]|nr:hypothetical protein [Planctomycetota bacterium]